VIDTTYTWLTAHPLSSQLIVGIVVGVMILFLTPVLMPKVSTFWNFCAIPPQRLSLWWLKAKLSIAEFEFNEICKLRDELPYLIYSCFRGILNIGICLCCLILSCLVVVLQNSPLVIEPRTKLELFIGGVLFLLLVLIGYVYLFRCFAISGRVFRAVMDPESSLEALESRIAKLTEKLHLDEVDS
jgi:hypothetical protein